MHHDFQSRCAQPARYVRHEAGGAGRSSRAVQADRDQGRFSALRDPAAARRDRRQVFDRPIVLPHRRRRSRCRLADDANRAAIHRRRQLPARRCGAAVHARPTQRLAGARGAARNDGARRRQSAQRPGGRIPGQGVRSVCIDGGPEPREFQSARPACRRRRLGDVRIDRRRRMRERDRRHACKTSRRPSRRRCSTRISRPRID